MHQCPIVKTLVRIAVAAILSIPAGAAPVSLLFSTGTPDGLIATLSRPASPGLLETETADDFILSQSALISQATFTGLLPLGASLSTIQEVEIELYHVFPLDSGPPDGRVLTRVNSPSDNQFAAFDEAAGDISVTASILNSTFSVLNTVVNGIHAMPNQFTGGEGPTTGEEVQISVTFNTPFLVLSTDHDFFRPEVLLSSGNFLWLSAPRPILPPGTPFTGDLQSWIRNDGVGALAPDWERIGTDVTAQGPFNATFSLSGQTVPEPSGMILVGTGLIALSLGWRQIRPRVK
jgi:hypothetical protein